MRALLCCLLLSGCVAEENWVDLDLETTTFVNPWVLEGQATRTTIPATGFDCPDDRVARIDLIQPTGFEGPRPLALLLHDGAYDWLDANGTSFEDAVQRLGALYADEQVARLLGVDGAEVDGSEFGVWPATLLQAGYAVVVPGNCWGDLWHGQGDNNLQLEGFLRQGARLASEAIQVARAHEGVSDQRLLGIGLGDGGRGIAELALQGVAFDAVTVDAPPDWISPVLQQPALFQRYITGLERIWDAELPDTASQQERLALMQDLLQRDSFVHLVADLGWRVPIIYAWSSTDEILDPDQARPAAETIAASYPDTQHRVLDWQEPAHAPSNGERALDVVAGFVTWIDELLGDFVHVPPAAPPAP